jgi:hypothetical protein
MATHFKTFPTGTAQTWVVPDGVLFVTVVGCGGGGGGAGTDGAIPNKVSHAAGAGAGAAVITATYLTTPGENIVVDVGAGGTRGPGGHAGHASIPSPIPGESIPQQPAGAGTNGRRGDGSRFGKLIFPGGAEGLPNGGAGSGATAIVGVSAAAGGTGGSPTQAGQPGENTLYWQGGRAGSSGPTFGGGGGGGGASLGPGGNGGVAGDDAMARYGQPGGGFGAGGGGGAGASGADGTGGFGGNGMDGTITVHWVS